MPNRSTVYAVIVPNCYGERNPRHPAGLVGASLDDPPSTVDLCGENGLLALKRPQGGTHDLADGLTRPAWA